MPAGLVLAACSPAPHGRRPRAAHRGAINRPGWPAARALVRTLALAPRSRASTNTTGQIPIRSTDVRCGRRGVARGRIR
eukprot:scaffold5059_cov120-Isochrysis_galbana.AAC.5